MGQLFRSFRNWQPKGAADSGKQRLYRLCWVLAAVRSDECYQLGIKLVDAHASGQGTTAGSICGAPIDLIDSSCAGPGGPLGPLGGAGSLISGDMELIRGF